MRSGELDDHEGDFAQSRHGALLRTEPDGRMAWGEDTHICLDKQLPCLYPFPQRSQRRSAMARFPSPLTRCDPSLARLFRFLVLTGLGFGLLASAFVGPVDDPSLAWLGDVLRATGGSWLGLFMLRER